MSEEKPKTRSKLFATMLAMVVLGGLFASILLNVVLGVGLIVTVASGDSKAKTTRDKLKTKVMEGEGEDKILVIDINGMIISSPMWQDELTTPMAIKERLKKAEEDADVKAVIFKINSPGGTITATDKIYQNILDFKAKKNCPVIAYIDEVAASGGYYLASACDKIICHPTAITGSIGVIMSFYQMQDLFEKKLGIKEVVLKSGLHKDIGSASRDLTKQEREILQSLIDEMYERFLDVVKKGRTKLAALPKEELVKIADGRIYTGKQALAKNLVDSLGYFEQAVAETAKIAKLSKKQLISYERRRSVFDEILQGNIKSEPMIKQFAKYLSAPKFYYLWKP